VRPKAWVLCEKRRRLLNKNGFIAVNVIIKQGELMGVERKKCDKFMLKIKNFTPLKPFKIKGV
jgi:hypothetical protein